MAGNIFSRALLSIFMDKKARATYDAVQKSKRRGETPESGEPAQPAQGSQPAPPPTNDDDDDILPETLIHQAIEAASQELDRKKNLPPGRQALIEQALSIHDQQSKLLDDLPKEQREKLMFMAMHAFGADLENTDKAAAQPKQATRKRREP